MMKSVFWADFGPVWKEFLGFQAECVCWAELVMATEWSEGIRERFRRLESRKSVLDRQVLVLRKYEEIIEFPGGQKLKQENPWIAWVFFLAQSQMIRAQALYRDALRRHQDEVFPVTRRPSK